MLQRAAARPAYLKPKKQHRARDAGRNSSRVRVPKTGRKLFFSEEKNQKTFSPGGWVVLLAADDEVFARLVAGHAPEGFALAAGGIEGRPILEMLRDVAARVRAGISPAAWVIIENGEAVGLCSLMNAPDAAGQVEIGYGVAASRRGQGAASRAVAEMVRWAHTQPDITHVTANTAVANLASQRVLAANGFSRTGTRTDPEDGDLICWKIDVASGLPA
jgi:hypothetical protein